MFELTLRPTCRRAVPCRQRRSPSRVLLSEGFRWPAARPRQYLEGNLSGATSPSDLRRLSRLANLSTSASRRNADGGKPTYHRRLLVEDGVIYRLMGSPKHAQTKLPWVPDSLRIPVIAAFHGHMGHLSRDRTIAAIQQRYYWPRLRDDVALYVEECHECTLSKPPRSSSHRPQGPTIGRYPFDLLYADILDMSNTSDYDAKNWQRRAQAHHSSTHLKGLTYSQDGVCAVFVFHRVSDPTVHL